MIVALIVVTLVITLFLGKRSFGGDGASIGSSDWGDGGCDGSDDGGSCD